MLRYDRRVTPSQPIQHALARARYIRAIGPTTDDFMRWRDATEEVLIGLIGEDHPALERYREAVGAPAELDAEGLQIHGPFGMAPRIERAEAVLRSLGGGN